MFRIRNFFVGIVLSIAMCSSIAIADVSSLKSPIYVPWNSFLGMTNIIEIVNPDSSEKSITLKYFDISGTLLETRQLSVPALGQFDVILNDLGTYVTYSYGLVVLEFAGNLDGRISFYKPIFDDNGLQVQPGYIGQFGIADFEEDFDGYFQFAYSIPFVSPLTGESATTFNTYWPSYITCCGDPPVANWLTIINTEDNSRAFRVRKFDIAGALLSDSNVLVAGKGRVDIEGGHVFPGHSNVGLLLVEPLDSGTEYLSFISRFAYAYGSRQEPSDNFRFAIVLMARKAALNTLIASADSLLPLDQNWLEIVNTSSSQEFVTIDLYNLDGTYLDQRTFQIAAYAQRHIDVLTWVNQFPLPEGVTGALPGFRDGIGYAVSAPRVLTRS